MESNDDNDGNENGRKAIALRAWFLKGLLALI